MKLTLEEAIKWHLENAELSEINNEYDQGWYDCLKMVHKYVLGKIMEESNIERYKPTGELCATIDFGRNSVDWNKIHEELQSGCHCIWAESDLESYVKVFSKEEKCLRDRLLALQLCTNEKSNLPNRNHKVDMTEIRIENF